MSTTLPGWLRDLLSACPKHGGGVHNWLFRCARQLHAHYSTPSEIIDLLAAACYGCGRQVTHREIEAAVQRSRECAWRPSTNRQLTANYLPSDERPKWPAVNEEQRAAIVRDGPRLADLWEAVPVRVDWNGSKTEEIIDVLFPGNPLLCCGKSSYEFATRTRDKFRGKLSSLPLIVPSPMSKRTGITKEGRESEHCLDNTGRRRFLVVEFDEGTFDEHAALLWHLAGIGPLALCVHSGSKSLHGWFFCGGQPEDKLCAFMRHAVSLGADPATWTRSQFVRMPDGTRQNGKRQAVYYFRPDVVTP
jgi:hypothetical protein